MGPFLFFRKIDEFLFHSHAIAVAAFIFEFFHLSKQRMAHYRRHEMSSGVISVRHL